VGSKVGRSHSVEVRVDSEVVQHTGDRKQQTKRKRYRGKQEKGRRKVTSRDRNSSGSAVAVAVAGETGAVTESYTANCFPRWKEHKPHKNR
jgi:hypothetical protein